MEERSYNNKAHRIIISMREEMSLTGVTDVISFDETAIIVETEVGMLEIRGTELHVNQLNLENGEMSLTGDISGVEYDEKAAYKKGSKNLIGRLFG